MQGLDGGVDRLADLLLHGADDLLGGDVLLVGVHADGVEAVFLGGLEHARAGGGGDLEDDVRALVVQGDGALLAQGGVVIAAGIVGLHADVGVVVFRALLVAHDEVVDGVGILAAHGADDAALGDGGGDIARQEGALILGVGDVQHIVDGLGGGIVNPDEADVGIVGGDGLDVVELPADADHDLVLVGGVAHLGRVVFVVALDGGDLDAQVLRQAVNALLGGIVERAVAKGAGHDQGQSGLPAFLGGLLLAAAEQAGQQTDYQNDCDQFFHFGPSFYHGVIAAQSVVIISRFARKSKG